MTSWTKSIGAPSRSSTRINAPKLSTYAATLVSALSICAASRAAYADELEITTLEQGEPAPFTGDLFPPDLSVRWALEIEGCAQRAAIELEHAKLVQRVELARRDALAENSAKANRQRVELLTAELEAARAWYRSPIFVFTIGATVAVAVLLTSTVLVQATGEVTR
jgi:hypothetical protein